MWFMTMRLSIITLLINICPKIFSNGQIDRALKEGIITLDFLHALNQLSEELPDICASTYVIAE